MKKIVTVLMIVFSLALPLFAEGSQEVKAAEPTTEFEKATIKFGTASAESTVIVKAMRAFADKVATRTNGQVTIQIFPSSQLGNPTEIIRSTQMGAVDMCIAQPASLASMGVKEMGVLVLPYIFKSFDQRMNVLFGPIGNDLLDKVSISNNQLKGFGYYPDGARSFFTVKGKAIRSLSDMKGMKLRVQPTPMDTDMAVALGASPTPIAFAELYSAMQSGVVDGAEQPVTSYYAGKYYEVSKFLTLDEHTYNTTIVLFSDMSWKKRSPQVQKILSDSWTETIIEFKGAIQQGEVEALAKVKEAGIEVIQINDRAKWEDAMKPIYTKHGAGLETLISQIQSTK